MSDPTQTARTAAPAKKQRVSLIFLSLLLVFAVLGVELAIGRGGMVGVFAFVFVGWIISLCLHEFGHAFTAWFGGDRSVAELGYLTLNPLRYANPLMSIVLPLVFLAIGGIGFPGGAVYVNQHALRGRIWRAAVSAAGPAMNVLCLIVIALGLHFAAPGSSLAGALAFLGLLQATAILLNLLPIPGLDGFTILMAAAPEKERDAIAPISRIASILFLVLIYSYPPLLTPIWNVALRLCLLLGIGGEDIGNGYDLFQFWSQN